MIVGINVFKTDGSCRLLDLKPDTRLRIEQITAAFDTRLESGLFSFPIDVPWTEGNRQWLGFVENLNSSNTSLPEYWRCEVLCNGITYLGEGKLKMLSHAGAFDNIRGEYKFIITGVKGLFGNLIKGKKLTDLNLEGKVTWDVGIDSRMYAKKVMTGDEPASFDKFKFAPVLIEKYIDETRSDFNTEYLYDDVVNGVVVDPSLTNGWTFGRIKPSVANAVTTPGDPGYADYRTIPFLNLHWVLRQLFIEFGFTAIGDFFDYPDFDKLHIYNTVSIDRYTQPFTFDVNHEITPANHLPEILVSDFLVAIQNAFNLNIIWRADKHVLLNFNTNLLASKRIRNFTNKCAINYQEAQRHEAYENGLKLEFKFDGNDSYSSDRVKETDDINIIAEVDVYNDIASLILPATIDETTYIYVAAENYYYNYEVANSRWIPAIEYLDRYQYGKGEVLFQPELAPMCQAYRYDAFGNYNRLLMVAASQRGSYINDMGIRIENEFGLRLFYIDQLDTGAYTMLPFSFCHNYDINGNKLADTSLSWLAKDGLYSKLWKSWLDMLINSWQVSASFFLDIVEVHDLLNNIDIILANNNQYLIRRISHNLPITNSTDIDLVKL